MNEWGSWKTWRRARARKELEDSFARLCVANPELRAAIGVEKRRWVRVTRFTVQPKRVDDANVDAIGGKMPVDTLVRKGLLVDDTPQWVRREARVEKTLKGNTHVLVEVFECSQEGHDSKPEDGEAETPRRGLGEFTREILRG